MESVSLYSEARNEYMKQLSTWIVPPLVEFFRKEYNSIRTREGKRAMVAFQEFCSTIPRWNQDVIETNINIILDNCRCDYVEELMTAVFIAHTKMLTAIRVNGRQKKLQITLPKLDHFLHRVFVECARAFWKAPFLFAETASPVEMQKNLLQAESMTIEALGGAVRSLLPVKNILRDYLDDDGSDEELAPVQNKRGGSKKVESDSESDDDSVEEAIDTAAPTSELPAFLESPALAAALGSSAPSAQPAVPAAAPPAPAASPAAPVQSEVLAAPVQSEVLAAPVHSEVLAAPVQSEVPAAPTLSIQESPKQSVTIEKLETTATPSAPAPSSHTVESTPVKNSVVVEKDTNEAPQLMIETEPAVHFTPYDTVYDETTSGISEIRYAPKVSVEDKPPSTWGLEGDYDVPKLQISGAGESLLADEIEDINGPSKPAVPPPAPAPVEVDIDEPLTLTNDFETLN